MIFHEKKANMVVIRFYLSINREVKISLQNGKNIIPFQIPLPLENDFSCKKGKYGSYPTLPLHLPLPLEML